MDVSAAAELWRRDGFVVLPAFLDGPPLRAAQAALTGVFPAAESYHDDATAAPHRRYTGDEYGGIIPFPFPDPTLCQLVIDDPLVAFARAVFNSEHVQVYASELWAKFTGAADYEQEHHRDYLNHTPLAPSSDVRWRGLEMFIWLHDVPEELGPTHIVPLPYTANLPALPHGYEREERADLYDVEISGAGPAGTVVAYSTDTFHRGTNLTLPRGARYTAHVSFRHPDNTWTSRHAWGVQSFHPHWAPFVESATLSQLQLFGFPPPGHGYWTSETLAGVALRYPSLDLTSVRANDV